MANFTTHVAGAAVVTGVAAVAMQALGFIETPVMVGCWIMGIVGGLAPDLDSDDPKALSIIFNIITAVVWVILLFGLVEQLSLLEFSIAIVAATLFVRVGLYFVFLQLTSHRGNFHSIVGGLITAFIVAAIAGRITDGFTAWVLAGFCFLGFITHLVMDELFKVNLVNESCQKPLFSALKVVSLENKPMMATMCVVALVMMLFTPGLQPLIDGYHQRADVAQTKMVHVWPEDNRIFGVEMPNIAEYLEYDFDIRTTEKGADLQRNLGITEENFESTRAKLTQYWQSFVDKIMQLRAQPNDTSTEL